jgi:hypothetical protein
MTKSDLDPDDDYWVTLNRELRAERNSSARAMLLDDLRRRLKEMSIKDRMQPGGYILCDHTTLIEDLKQRLRAYDSDIRTRSREFAESADQLASHVGQCASSKIEVTPLETGMAIYGKLLDDPDSDAAAASRWLGEVGSPTPPPPQSRAAALAAPSTLLPIAIHVASYLGVAGIGGIVGNRADAICVATAKDLFNSVRNRWLKRASDINTALSENEAVDAAKAAVIASKYEPSTVRLIYSTQLKNQDWVIRLEACLQKNGRPEYLRALVPSGDPERTTIMIYR